MRSKEACNNYEPNWPDWQRSGQLCTGMGASPLCIWCGQTEQAHIYKEIRKEFVEFEF